jgi:hypothetical protein
MSDKYIIADCIRCESTYDISYATEVTSTDLPEFCPFCEVIEKENIQDDSPEVDDDDLDEDDDVYEFIPEE